MRRTWCTARATRAAIRELLGAHAPVRILLHIETVADAALADRAMHAALVPARAAVLSVAVERHALVAALRSPGLADLAAGRAAARHGSCCERLAAPDLRHGQRRRDIAVVVVDRERPIGVR